MTATGDYRVAMEPDVSLHVEGGMLTLCMPAVPNSDRTGDPFRPELDLIQPVDTGDRNEMILAAITARLTWTMHELAEWLTINGQPVFDPHPNPDGDDTELFEQMADQAHKLAAWMLRKHPKPRTSPTS